MKIRKIAAIISAAALALTLTGCGNDPVDNLFNNPQNGQSSGTASKTVESTTAESKPSVQLPDIPVNDAAAFEYKYDSELGGMVITDYKLQSPKVHIPDKLENENVVKVEFGGVKKDITHIIMPDTVKEFNLSDQIKRTLQFVNIPASVTELKEKEVDYYTIIGFFEGCSNLTSISISDGLTKIGKAAFKDCTSLTSVTLPDSVTEIGDSAFDGCTSLANVTYNGKTYFNEHYFWLNDLYDAINLGESGMLIEDGVLKDVSRELTKVVIPSGVTKIDEWAFSGLSPAILIYYYVNNSETEIEESVYGTNLTSVTIPDSVTMIGSHAFSNCKRLTSVTIPDGVTKIGDGAFYDCENIKATYKGKTYDYEHIGDLYKAINGN